MQFKFFSCFEQFACKASGPSSSICANWLANVWLPFDQEHKFHYKRFAEDRRKFSHQGARGHHFQEIITGPERLDRLKKNYSPSLKLNNSIPYVSSSYTMDYSIDFREIPLAKVKHKPYDPEPLYVSNFRQDVSKNSTGSYLYKWPGKTGAMPSAKVPVNDTIAFVSNSDMLPKRYRKQAMDNYCLDGGSINTMKQFNRYFDGQKHHPKSYKRRRGICDSLLGRYPAPMLKKPHFYHNGGIPFKYSALPSGETGQVFKTKAESFKQAWHCGLFIWKKIHEAPHECATLCTPAGKHKTNNDKGLFEELQSRRLTQQDHVDYMVGKPYAYQIEKFLFKDVSGPIVIGKSTTHFGYSELLHRCITYDYGIEFDWSAFDATLSREIIVCAFAVLRSFFPEDPEIDNAFVYFCHGFVDKYMLNYDGKLYKVERGNPSGTVWTTLVNSVANALLMEDICSEYPAFKGHKYDYQVAGDDGLIFFGQTMSFENKSLIRWCKERWDMDLEIARSGATISNDPNKSLTFNKLCYYESEEGKLVPTVQPDLLHKRLLSPQKDLSTSIKLTNFLEGQEDQLLGHPDCVRIIAAYTAYHRAREGMSNLEFQIIYDSTCQRIERNVRQTYFSIAPFGEYLRYDFDNVKKSPDIHTEVFEGLPNETFITNWLYDNTIGMGAPKPTKLQRYNWFVWMMGERIKLRIVASRDPSEVRRRLKNKLVPDGQYEELVESYLDWENWFDLQNDLTRTIEGGYVQHDLNDLLVKPGRKKK